MLCHFEVAQNRDLWFTLPPTESQNRDLWFTLQHETDQIAMCIQTENLPICATIYITGAFNSCQIQCKDCCYTLDCSIRVFNLDNPPTYNNNGAKKPPCNKVISPD